MVWKEKLLVLLVCVSVQIGVEITVQINSETERRMWDVLNLPPFKSAAEASQQNFINKT